MTIPETLAAMPVIPRVHPDHGAFGCGLCEWERPWWKPISRQTVADLRQVKQCEGCRAAALKEHADRRASLTEGG